MQSVEDKILARLYRKGRTFAFSGVDFRDLGKRAAVDKALCSLIARGKIRRLARGLFDYPGYDERLGGELSAYIHQVAKAIARKNGVRIQASGAVAANMLGLSTQVPAKYVYLTNGKSRTIVIGGQKIEFMHTAPKKMQKGHETSSLVADALRWMGKALVDESMISTVAKNLDLRSRRRLLKDLRYSEDWIYVAALRIAAAGDGQ